MAIATAQAEFPQNWNDIPAHLATQVWITDYRRWHELRTRSEVALLEELPWFWNYLIFHWFKKKEALGNRESVHFLKGQVVDFLAGNKQKGHLFHSITDFFHPNLGIRPSEFLPLLIVFSHNDGTGLPRLALAMALQRMKRLRVSQVFAVEPAVDTEFTGAIESIIQDLHSYGPAKLPPHNTLHTTADA